MTTEPFDATVFQVSDTPEHVVPNHKARAEPIADTIGGKLRGALRGSSGRDSTKQGSATPKLPKEAKPVPPYREGMYVEPMREFYEFLGMVLMPFRPKASMYLAMPEMIRDNETGELIEGKSGAQKCAEAWDGAAKKSPAVRRMLESFLVVSVWGTLVAVHIPLILAIADKGDDSGSPFAAMEEMLKRHAEGEQQ